METALILYAICASAVLIFLTLPRERPAQRTGPQAPNGLIKYVVIPSSSFHEWAHCHPNLMIFDLQAHRERNARHESIPEPLQVSPRDLSGLQDQKKQDQMKHDDMTKDEMKKAKKASKKKDKMKKIT